MRKYTQALMQAHKDTHCHKHTAKKHIHRYLTCVFSVLILMRISRLNAHLFLRYTNTPTLTQTAELSPTIQVFLSITNSHKSTVNLVSAVIAFMKDRAMMRISERSLDKITEEKRAGQMEQAVWFVQLSTAFGSHSRRWLIQT